MTTPDDKDDGLARDLAAFTGEPVRKIRRVLRRAKRSEQEVSDPPGGNPRPDPDPQ